MTTLKRVSIKERIDHITRDKIHPTQAVTTIGEVLNDDDYGMVPEMTTDDASQHRVFSEQEAKPPQMWSTHPANRDREDNAKNQYIAAEIDQRSAWLVFKDASAIREQISLSFYKSAKVDEFEEVAAADAVLQRFDRTSYTSQYRGMYLSRSPVRNFKHLDDILQSADINQINQQTLSNLYSESLAEQLELARRLDSERATLEALSSGALKPSGGIIRHRGEELKKSDIPDAIEQVARERRQVANQLKTHDANCRQAHLLAAKEIDESWYDYQLHLIHLLHCAEHLKTIAQNEQALLVNTWQVITADGQIGHFEKRRMLKVCQQIQSKMREISDIANQVDLPPIISQIANIKNWQEQMPKFQITNVDKKNWPDWCSAASQLMDDFTYVMGLIQAITLEELLQNEKALAEHYCNETKPEPAPQTGKVPQSYPVLMPGEEHVLQRKLDLWNRFQLAQGVAPTIMRSLVSLGIVGGTIYCGLLGVNI
jgi:hypothetical protein